jgi:hypothetical protein
VLAGRGTPAGNKSAQLLPFFPGTLIRAVSPRHPTPGDVSDFAIRSKARHGAGACP